MNRRLYNAMEATARETAPALPLLRGASDAVHPRDEVAECRVPITGFRCDRCEHEWAPRDPANPPKGCPSCKSRKWNQGPRKPGTRGPDVVSRAGRERAAARRRRETAAKLAPSPVESAPSAPAAPVVDISGERFRVRYKDRVACRRSRARAALEIAGWNADADAIRATFRDSYPAMSERALERCVITTLRFQRDERSRTVRIDPSTVRVRGRVWADEPVRPAKGRAPAAEPARKPGVLLAHKPRKLARTRTVDRRGPARGCGELILAYVAKHGAKTEAEIAAAFPQYDVHAIKTALGIYRGRKGKLSYDGARYSLVRSTGDAARAA